jgi:hypothetical protein
MFGGCGSPVGILSQLFCLVGRFAFRLCRLAGLAIAAELLCWREPAPVVAVVFFPLAAGELVEVGVVGGFLALPVCLCGARLFVQVGH